jgi:hypothetical protein
VLTMGTAVKPVYDSLRGYAQLRDPAWFLHPLMCTAVIPIYSYVYVRWHIYRLLGGKKEEEGRLRGNRP